MCVCVCVCVCVCQVLAKMVNDDDKSYSIPIDEDGAFVIDRDGV